MNVLILLKFGLSVGVTFVYLCIQRKTYAKEDASRK